MSTKIGSRSPQISTGVSSSAKTDVAQQIPSEVKTEKQQPETKTASPTKATTRTKAARSHARGVKEERRGSEAASQAGLKEKLVIPSTSGEKKSVAGAQSASSVSDSSSSSQMQTINMNVLTHVATTDGLKGVGDSVSDRLAFFDQMCAKANKGIPTSKPEKGEKQMNVMVAPEWLFAKSGDKAYTATEMQKITEGLQGISKKYPDMLIFGGSVSWEIPDKTNKDQFMMYNSSPVVQNGKVVHMYHKRNEGGETSVSPQNKGVITKKWAMDDRPYAMDESQKKAAIKSKVEHTNPDLLSNTSFFTHNGVNFSMELCADQAGKVAKTEYGAKFPDGRGTDMHILMSAGSALVPIAVPVKDGGIVVAVDGSGPGSSKVGVMRRPVDLPIKDMTGLNVGSMKIDYGIPTSLDAPDAKDYERVALFSQLKLKVPKKGDE